MRFAFVNILWISFSILGLLIFGFFPATASMFTIVRKWIQGETEFPIFKTFWTTYNKEFIKSNLLGLILCVIGCILYIDFMFLRNSANGLIQITYYPLLMVILFYLLTVLYVFPVFVHYDVKAWHVLKNSFLIMTMSPLMTTMMVVGSIVIYYLMFSLPGLIPFFGGSVLTFVLVWFCNFAFAKVQRFKTGQSEEDAGKQGNN